VPGYFLATQASSWVDAETLSTLYLTRCVQTPAGERNELVDIAAVLNAWSDSAGAHPLDAPDPLDELGLIYLLRALPDSDVPELVLQRHFDATRNPIRIRGLRHTTVQALGKTHEATVLELTVKQAGPPVIVYLSRDAARLPLRVELMLPVVGALRFTLHSATDLRRVALRHSAS
jgi:hypothetical protein